jgi:hypothetical protein
VSANKARPHVLVLPEDEADHQIAHGFVKRISPDRARQIQIMPFVGGWIKVLDRFRDEYASGMMKNTHRHTAIEADHHYLFGRLWRGSSAGLHSRHPTNMGAPACGT